MRSLFWQNGGRNPKLKEIQEKQQNKTLFNPSEGLELYCTVHIYICDVFMYSMINMFIRIDVLCLYS